jgi:5-deoxy-5-amino-3-dehydroquinate synthase
LSDLRRVHVELDGEDPYEIVVGPHALREAKDQASRRRVAIVTQRRIPRAYVNELREMLNESHVFTIPDGEVAKSMANVEMLCSKFAKWGLLRHDLVIAIGGGVVCDAAGFASAIYYRGVKVLKAPTSLLAQVDAASGGKTGVNLDEGKNLVGAFHQPVGVLADTSTLITLTKREYRSGLGEVAKYALMPEGRNVVALLQKHTPQILDRDAAVLRELVYECVKIKMDVVQADPLELNGRRAMLNFGHTLGHALETAAGHKIKHGEAVATGLVFATALSCALGFVDQSALERTRDVVSSLGLPVAAPSDMSARRLLTLMRRDKKASGGLTFILPTPTGLEPYEDPDKGALRAAFKAVGINASRI